MVLFLLGGAAGEQVPSNGTTGASSLLDRAVLYDLTICSRFTDGAGRRRVDVLSALAARCARITILQRNSTWKTFLAATALGGRLACLALVTSRAHLTRRHHAVVRRSYRACLARRSVDIGVLSNVAVEALVVG